MATATITSDALARRFLTAVGADPDNAALRRAVRIWKASEGGSICGNNPWFIRRTTYSKNRDGSSAGILCVNKVTRACVTGVTPNATLDCNFSKFKTLDDGVAATVAVLHNGRYSKVVAALRAGDALGFLRQLGASGWAAGGYNNALVLRYGNALLQYNVTLPLVAGSVDSAENSGRQSDPSIPGVNDLASLQAILVSLGIDPSPNHKFTHAEAAKIALTQYHVSGDVAAAVIGLWEGKTVQQMADAAASGDTLNSTPLPSVPNPLDALATVGQVFGFFLDVQNIGYLLAMLVGGGLALYGFSHIAGISAPRIGVPSPTRLL